MWRISRILNTSPFDPKLLDHTEAELDFILESFALDNPEEFRFVRPGETDKPTPAELHAAMESVLLGTARDSFLAQFMPSKAVLERAAQMSGAYAKLAASVKKG